jgi:MYXO-CTERM domain-containing protein
MNRSRLLVASICMAVCGPRAALAQIGSGWTKLTLTQDFIDTQSMGAHMRHDIATFTTSGVRYEKTADAETFELYDPSFNRVEHDTNYHYKTGTIQFEGTVEIFDGVNHQFIVQLFNAPASGPIMALSAFSRGNGTIVKQGGSVDVATNVFGKTVKVNIIHDLDANTLTVYIDGKSAWTGGGGAGGGFNFKYGSYGSLNESRSAKARWQNVQFWTGGSAGGTPPPRDGGTPGDAGAPSADAAADASAPAAPDAAGDRAADASNGAGGSGPAGGAGGSGPAGGAGGSGDGGSGGGTLVPTPGSSGCGCRLGGAGERPGGVALLLLAALARRRRSANKLG